MTLNSLGSGRLKSIFPIIAFAGFALLLFGLKLWAIRTYGNATPFWDQWDSEAANLYQPYFEGTLKWGDLVAPHNEHRMLTTNLLALGMLLINRVWNPILQMEINAVIHIVTICLSVGLLARVIGCKYLSVLVAFALVLFSFPYAWENSLYAIGSQFYFVLLFSILSLWLTMTHKPLSVTWWLGILAGTLAFFSVASGILVFAVAACVGVLLYAAGQLRSNRQLLAVLILISFFMVGVKLTPDVPYHAALKAASIIQIVQALEAILGWPIKTNFSADLFRNFPALIFFVLTVWKVPSANDRKWFLIGMVIWIYAQALMIAYGRALGNYLAPRYLDFFVINILVNFACLVLLVQGVIAKYQKWLFIIIGIWVIAILLGLGVFIRDQTLNELKVKVETGLAQETNTRNYLATHDLSNLQNKPNLFIPYPDAARLASILSFARIRDILPANIRAPLKPIFLDNNNSSAFAVNGFDPSIPRCSGFILGSFVANGSANIGKILVSFNESNTGGDLVIPLATSALQAGLSLEIEQHGQIRAVNIEHAAKGGWQLVHVEIDQGSFLLHLTDLSPIGWLAMGSPFLIGRLDSLADCLLDNYKVFIGLGFIILAISLIFVKSSAIANNDMWQE